MQEYTVRVPSETNKKYHVMRFSASNNVDVTKWKSVKLDRENAPKDGRFVEEEIPKFGAGSEFGREAREEARRRKYARYAKKLEDQPWILNVKTAKTANTPGKTSRKFKGSREGGVTDNTSYYVFFQAHDGAFEAFPISEWYNFTPIPRFKALTAEEAEEQFENRGKILNFFPVMANKKKNDLNSTNDPFLDEGIKVKKGKDFKVSDMDDWGDLDMSGGSDADSDDDRPSNKKGKKANAGSKKKKKQESDDDDDSEPLEESDEGDFDTREVDYMSDSSSDSDDDADRLIRELKGVEDEDALRKLVLSDDEDDEENNEANKDKEGDQTMTTESGDGPADKSKAPDGDLKVKVKKEKTSSGPSSDESEDSDFDDTKYQSAMFMQKGEREAATAADSKSAATKRKLETPENSASTSGKKAKITAETGVTEEAVKRYLMRKPITTTELLHKFKSKKIQICGSDLVATIAQILKKLNPQRQTINDKMYLYIKPK